MGRGNELSFRCWVKVCAGRSLIEVVKHWALLTGVLLALSVVSGRAVAQPAAPAAPAPAAQTGVPPGQTGAPPPPVAVQPTAAQSAPVAQPPVAVQPTAAPQPMPPQGGFPPPYSGRWMPAPDGGYVWVPGAYELPPTLPYREGQPVPPGYHVEERRSRGAIITGYILTGVPYGIGLLAAVSSNFTNSSGYLLVPWAGPWLTLGFRKNRCETSEDPAQCAEDMGVGMGLVMDGIVQGAGGVLLLVAHLAPYQKLIRNDQVSFRFTPVGTGYGVGASGIF